jgi:hypothetical protein
VKTRRIVGCIAVAFAYVSACGGSSSSFGPSSATNDGGGDDGAAESGDGASGPEGGAGDDGHAASAGSEAGAGDGAAFVFPDAGPTQYCCVSGAYYACPDVASLAQCSGFGVSNCLQGCASTDEACANACGQMASSAQTDASTCTRDPSRDGVCIAPDASSSVSNYSTNTSTGTPPAPQKNACGGFFVGLACSVGGECNGGLHCTQGDCYPNDVGNPCTFPTDCGSGNHCASGCCANNSKGSPCNTGIDCKSMMCTNGVCQ